MGGLSHRWQFAALASSFQQRLELGARPDVLLSGLTKVLTVLCVVLTVLSLVLTVVYVALTVLCVALTVLHVSRAGRTARRPPVRPHKGLDCLMCGIDCLL